MKIKRVLVLLLAFLLVFSNSAFAAMGPITDSQVDNVNQLKPSTNNEENPQLEELKDVYKDSDDVRVIVEVEGAPAITYATQQGVKFADLSEAKKEQLHSEALSVQEKVQNQIANEKVNLELRQYFTTVFNGFSGIVKFGDIEKIQNVDGVANVTVSNEYELPEVTPDMMYSEDMVQAQKTWDEYGYDGEGMIVGVIDSGIDPGHRDFVLTDEDEATLSEGDVAEYIANYNLPGKYYSAKVPYGYNYMDENDEVRDIGPGASMHGMHVSGTVGANGDEENGGIKGVAPESQILGLKVFGNDPGMGSTWADIYIRAIDDAIILGADVLNMSLGSVAAFVSPDDPEQEAIANAVENGILMSISAGNSAHLGNGFYNPYSSNPDIGVVGAPGVSYDSLQVASIDNTHMDMDAVTYSFDGVEDLAPFMSASNVHPDDLDENTFALEYANLGGPGDFDGKDFNGKFALIQRGEYDFVTKALNAQAEGAAGVIVYNNADGWVNMASDDAIVIPQLFMSKTDGDLLAAQIEEGVEVTIAFEGETTTAVNPTGNHMSSFTSWGVTPNLDFKPEITAPGGNILSTFNDDEYGTMSGTSMAAPHVAGGSALVLQRVNEDFDLDGKARVNMAKNILMNTADPVLDKGAVNSAYGFEVPYSPRRQGSGIMQLHSAISTPVVVTEQATGEGKVALKEVGDQFSFTLEAENVSDEAVTYDLSANVQTDFQIHGLMGNALATGVLDELEAAEITGADITFNGGMDSITVPAGETVTIDVAVDLTDALAFSVDDEGNFGYLDPETIFPNGYFVEGFVTLTDQEDVNPELSVAYVGFKGDWNAAPILDELAYDGNDSFYEQAAMLYECDGGQCYLGYDPFTGERSTANIAISPNGDGVQEAVIPLLSFLRNAKTVEYNVLDEDGNQLRKIKSENNIRKNYYDAGAGSPYRLDTSLFWDGTVNKEVVPDGQYYFEVSATIDFPGAEAQKFQYPVIVDTVGPEVDVSIDGTELTITGSDELSGLRYFELLVDGESQGIIDPGEGTVVLDLGSDIPEDVELAVIGADYAGNETLLVPGDEDAPVIEVVNPATFSIHNTNEVYVLGLATDPSGVAEVTVQGQQADLTDVGDGQYIFEADIEFEDGANPIRITATDVNGNTTSLENSRTIFVDSTAPGLEVQGDTSLYVDYETTEVELTVAISDNAEELRLLANDNEVYYNEMPGYEMVPFNDEVTFTVPVAPGENVIELELFDLADNLTSTEVNVYRAHDGEERVDRIKGDDRYATAVELSKAGWEQSDVVVLARGNEYSDALASIPLAKKYDAPLLLTRSASLNPETKAEIERLGAKTVYVVGGTQAVSADVVSELQAQGITVNRLSGETRFETAVEIANEVIDGDSAKEVVLVNGRNFPDALSVASYAASNGLPILLTAEDELSPATQRALYDLDVTKTLVIGGTVAISDEVVDRVPNPLRISGETRYETAVEVAKYFDVDADQYYVATGRDYADALSSAALASKNGTGILLVGSDVSDALAEFIQDEVNALTVIGGTVAVSDEVLAELKQLLD